MTEEKRSRFSRQITLGNIISVLTIVSACGGFFLSYHDRLIRVEAAQLSSDRSDIEFRREILQRLADLQTDVRELRASNGVRWSELPPRRRQ
jgi:cell division protein FtsL